MGCDSVACGSVECDNVTVWRDNIPVWGVSVGVTLRQFDRVECNSVTMWVVTVWRVKFDV